MAARITVITHNHHRDAGQAPDALTEAGATVRQWDVASEAKMPDYQSYDGLVVLGGPMRSSEQETYPWLKDELVAIERCLSDNKPILGVCLGAQFICELSGGQVEEAALPERQYNYMRVIDNDPLVENFPALLALYNMHSDTMILPPEAKEFLVGGWCPQGVRFGDRAWGVQFHPEATNHLIEYWHSRLEDQLQELGSNRQEQNRHYQSHAAENQQAGRLLFSNFVKAIS